MSQPDWVRVKDKTTGHRYSVRGFAVDEDRHTVLADERATDASGRPLPAEYAEPTTEPAGAAVPATDPATDPAEPGESPESTTEPAAAPRRGGRRTASTNASNGDTTSQNGDTQ